STSSNEAPSDQKTNQPASNATNEPPIEPDVDKAANALNLGNRFLAEGRVKEAINQYRIGVKYQFEDEDCHYNLALALARDGQNDEAVKEYQEALKIFPDYVEAHNNLGNLLVRE